jgi:hypothetical protein
MTGLTRRRLMAAAAGSVPLVALSSPAQAFAAKGNVLLVHDDTLPAARRFAIRARLLGAPSQALEGSGCRSSAAGWRRARRWSSA